MRKILTLYCLVNIFLSGCAVYRIDIQQGNQVTQKMLDQLEVNMPAKKVRFIMGTPLVRDVFHQQRWDYLYSFQAGGGKREQRHISLYFDKNQILKKIEGDVKIGKRHKPKPSPLPELDQEPIL